MAQLTYIEDIATLEGQAVRLRGWLHKRRHFNPRKQNWQQWYTLGQRTQYS